MSTAPTLTERRSQLLFTMAQVNKQWRRTVDHLLHPWGLTQAQWLPLLHLAHAQGAMRQKDLAHSLALDSSSIVRLIDSLEAHGWVQREDCADRRVKHVALTEAGLARATAIEQQVNSVRNHMLERFTPDLLNQLQPLLDDALVHMAQGDATGAPR